MNNTTDNDVADDVAVVCLFKQMMNKCLNIALAYSRKWRFEFNIKKTFGLIFGPDRSPHQQLMMGGEPIEISNGKMHMGVPLAVDNHSQLLLVRERTESVRRQTSAMMTLGSWHCPLPPVTGVKIYRAVCLSRMLYGIEACDIGRASITELEATHRSCALRLQGLPPQTSMPVPLATLGWVRIQASIDIAKIIFLFSLLLLPLTCVYKRVVIARLAYHVYDPGTGNHEGPIPGTDLPGIPGLPQVPSGRTHRQAAGDGPGDDHEGLEKSCAHYCD